MTAAMDPWLVGWPSLLVWSDPTSTFWLASDGDGRLDADPELGVLLQPTTERPEEDAKYKQQAEGPIIVIRAAHAARRERGMEEREREREREGSAIYSI